MKENNVKVLSDRGIRNKSSCYSPIDPELTTDDVEYNSINYEYRSVVENIYARISSWGAANNQFKQDLDFQAFTLTTIYQIEAYKVNKRPPRNWEFNNKKPIRLKHFDLLDLE